MNSLISWDYGGGIYGKCFWFRIFGYGIHFKRHDSMMLFSERYGYSKRYRFFMFSVMVLKP